MMRNTNFVAFILTHGRPDNVVTYTTLKKQGYTGRIIFIIDNEDKTADQYYENFGKENVIMFDKKAISETFDTADNFNDRRAIVYARNACFNIAKDLGIKYFIQLDDDYVRLQYRFNNEYKYIYRPMWNPDEVFDILIDFYKSTQIKSIAMAQGGDFIGGGEGKKVELKRKCMNSFICGTDNPINFIGRINDDVNVYTRSASTGDLFFTTTQVSIVQKQTQSSDGGMTETYREGGTYLKSFYSVMFQPSSVKIAMMGDANRRIHHNVKWNNTVPKIIRENIKRETI